MSDAAAAFVLEGVEVLLGGRPVLGGISMEIRYGELLVVLGASGSGKTTLLRLLAGLIAPAAGTLLVNGKDSALLPPAKRDLAFAFQNYSLYPSKSVAGNLDFPLRIKGRSLSVRKRRLAAMLRFIGNIFRKRRRELPSGFSMGEKQRVSVGRALADDRSVVLLDEPLSEVDHTHKARFIRRFRALASEEGAAVVYVTNNESEAMALADRIAVLDQGRLLALGPPMDLYRDPPDLDAARSLGAPEINTAAAECGYGGLTVDGRPLGYPCASVAGTDLCAAVRPEGLRLVDDPDAGFPSEVLLVERVSPDRGFVHLGFPEGWVLIHTGERFPGKGDTVRVAVKPGSVLFFSGDGRRIRG